MAKTRQILSILILNLYFCKCDDFALDISAPDEDINHNKINKTTYHIDGLACRKLAPKPHNRIIKVVEGKTPIWTANNSECTGVIIYPETGQSRLVHLFIAKSAKNTHEYYAKEGDQWKKVDEMKYKERMSEFHPEERDPAKPTGKKKMGSASVPNIITVFAVPLLLYTFSN